jgi:polyhydroxyalkanoate synthase
MENTAKNFFQFIDDSFQAHLAKATHGVSPAAMQNEYMAWLSQLALAPGKMMELAAYPVLHAPDVARRYMGEKGPGNGTDPRFNSPKWSSWPYRLYAATFLAMEDWWNESMSHVPGLDDRTERSVNFLTKQMIDAFSPTNFPTTNPEVFDELFRSGGSNFITGFHNWYDDFQRTMKGKPPAGVESYEVGKNLAITPGKVVLRTKMMELMQFTPTTTDVYKEPVLIFPAWIMKYYILDLSAKNSMVRWLVEKGHTVFILSWVNPGSEDSHLGFEDYFRDGAMAAINAVSDIVPDSKIHLAGYCLGGTLAMLTAAAMAGKGDDRLKSLTALAAQGDFTEAGELLLFINASKISFLEKLTNSVGYLDSKQMANTFQALRAYDMIWSKIINEYMLGRREKMIDIMAWNADATRLPAKMFGEYMNKLFLNNDFMEGRFIIDGHPVAPDNIRVPAFAVGTEKDHVVPWRSAHKIHLMVPGDVTFALTNGGHNAGIVSEPGRKNRRYRVLERKAGEPYLNPEAWYEKAELRENESWWLAWEDWLVRHSTPSRVIPPKMGSDKYPPICDAPGTYVYVK